MRDPELVARAQRAAARLESAWERWNAHQGLGETPAQPVVGLTVLMCMLSGLTALRKQVREEPAAPVLTVTSAIKSDILAVTSQLSGLQLGHSFLPGSDARLSITSAG